MPSLFLLNIHAINRRGFIIQFNSLWKMRCIQPKIKINFLRVDRINSVMPMLRVSPCIESKHIFDSSISYTYGYIFGDSSWNLDKSWIKTWGFNVQGCLYIFPAWSYNWSGISALPLWCYIAGVLDCLKFTKRLCTVGGYYNESLGDTSAIKGEQFWQRQH